MNLPPEADVVVIGSGAMGASATFHLAKPGTRRVVLIEQYETASQTSPRAAGLTAQARTTDVMTRLAIMSVKAIERLHDETGESMVFHQSGSLRIARTEQHAALIKHDADRAGRLGLDIELIDPADARRMSPQLKTSTARAICYTPSDLYFEPRELPHAYLRAAERRGAVLMPKTKVTSIAMRNGLVDRVITDRGEIHTSTIVDAAGAWARLVSQMVDLTIPVVPTRHQLLITEKIAGVESNQPIVRIVDANVYVRPDQGGLMLGGYEPEPRQYDAQDIEGDFDVSDLELDVDVLRRLADKVESVFPVFQDAAIREHRGGLPTMTADGYPLVGPVPNVKGFFVMSGCCVGGLSLSPALGSIVAQWIAEGEPPSNMSLMAPDRFGPEYDDADRLKQACRQRYALHYQQKMGEP